jgi:hypothetical protein
MKKLLIAACLCSFQVFAGLYSTIDLSIREAAVREFVTSENTQEINELYDSIEVFSTIGVVEGCNMLYTGRLLVKNEMVYFDACVLVKGRRDVNVAISERNIND